MAINGLLEKKSNYQLFDLGLDTDCALVEAIDTGTGEIFIAHRSCLDKLPVSDSGYVFCRYHDTLAFPSFRNFMSKALLEDLMN